MHDYPYEDGPEPCLEPGPQLGQLCGEDFGHEGGHGSWLRIHAAPDHDPATLRPGEPPTKVHTKHLPGDDHGAT